MIPTNRFMLAKLKEQFLLTGKGRWVFPAKSETGHATNPHKAWYRACKDAGVEGLRFHDLRHTCATRLVESGVPLIAVKDLLGHSSISVTERYAHPSKSVVEGVEKLSAINILLTFDDEGGLLN